MITNTGIFRQYQTQHIYNLLSIGYFESLCTKFVVAGLVSFMYVNNEIGVTQPVKQIGEICRQHKIYFHTDAAQVITK